MEALYSLEFDSQELIKGLELHSINPPYRRTIKGSSPGLSLLLKASKELDRCSCRGEASFELFRGSSLRQKHNYNLYQFSFSHPTPALIPSAQYAKGSSTSKRFLCSLECTWVWSTVNIIQEWEIETACMTLWLMQLRIWKIYISVKMVKSESRMMAW